jgi:hypothetical protein
MEPSRSLNTQIFSRLDKITYRALRGIHNPLNITDIPHVDYSQPMDMLISQDCSGFNLGSFLIRRTEWTRRVLDMWWDPIFYEQKYYSRDVNNNRHQDWDHKEQDAFVCCLTICVNDRNTCMLLNHSYAALLASFRRDPSMLFRRVHVRVSKNVQIYSTTRRNTISWSIWRVARMSLEENSNLQMGT